MLEVAARSIGGLCARTLRFGAGVTLEELILRHALGLPSTSSTARPAPPGVMMLPIPRAGVLRAVDGQDAARAVPGIVGLEITVPPGPRGRSRCPKATATSASSSPRARPPPPWRTHSATPMPACIVMEP